jgi:hypothetical protein
MSCITSLMPACPLHVTTRPVMYSRTGSSSAGAAAFRNRADDVALREDAEHRHVAVDDDDRADAPGRELAGGLAESAGGIERRDAAPLLGEDGLDRHGWLLQRSARPAIVGEVGAADKSRKPLRILLRRHPVEGGQEQQARHEAADVRLPGDPRIHDPQRRCEEAEPEVRQEPHA